MKSLGDTYFLGKESEGRTLYADLGFNEHFLEISFGGHLPNMRNFQRLRWIIKERCCRF